jgi:hypothetical protein
MKVDGFFLFDLMSPVSQGAVRRLVLSGAQLIAAIAIGTAVMVAAKAAPCALGST